MSKLLQGRVITVNKTNYIVSIEQVMYQAILSGRFRFMVQGEEDYPVTGDYVNIRMINENEGIIESVLSRENVLRRNSVRQDRSTQIFASNINIIYICVSMNEDFNERKIRNFINLTMEYPFEVVVLLTKADLAEDLNEYITRYQQISSIPYMAISIYDKESMDQIYNHMAEKTAVLIGSSGVGKSTIVNYLLQNDYLKVNGIRESDAQGRHTTSHRELVMLEHGGAIIDTPGIRIIHSYLNEQMDEYYEDIVELSEFCGFRNCTHTHEPSCAVQEAIENGDVLEEHFQAYIKAKKFAQYAKQKEAQKQRLRNTKQ